MNDEKITVAGVTFNSEQVISAVVKIDGREIEIRKKEDITNKVGFSQHPASPPPQGK